MRDNRGARKRPQVVDAEAALQSSCAVQVIIYVYATLVNEPKHKNMPTHHLQGQSYSSLLLCDKSLLITSCSGVWDPPRAKRNIFSGSWRENVLLRVALSSGILKNHCNRRRLGRCVDSAR
jgi:hypothetical protein